MLGGSEASAEGVAKILKEFADPRIATSTARVVEKTHLSNFGVRGDGMDDFFILRAWAEFFQKPEFHFTTAKPVPRMRIWGLGRGSITIHRLRAKLQSGRPVLAHLTRMQCRQIWSAGAAEAKAAGRQQPVARSQWRAVPRSQRPRYDEGSLG